MMRRDKKLFFDGSKQWRGPGVITSDVCSLIYHTVMLTLSLSDGVGDAFGLLSPATDKIVSEKANVHTRGSLRVLITGKVFPSPIIYLIERMHSTGGHTG